MKMRTNSVSDIALLRMPDVFHQMRNEMPALSYLVADPSQEHRKFVPGFFSLSLIYINTRIFSFGS